MSIVIAIDFDGTIVDHRYPDVGAPVPGAIEWMKRFQEAGAKLILWTMRSDKRGDGIGPMGDGPDHDYLQDAVDYCRACGIKFWSVNGNPEQSTWTDSPKAYAHHYIDDAAVGCPLRENPRMGGRPFVDWDAVGPAMMRMIEPVELEA